MAPNRLVEVINDWRDDAFDFLRHQVPKILAVLLIAFILSRLLKLVSRHLTQLSHRQDLPSSVRSQQLRTLSGVVYSIGLFVILFIASMQILALLGVNMGPLLASAGIAGLAIGFGAQTLGKGFHQRLLHSGGEPIRHRRYGANCRSAGSGGDDDPAANGIARRRRNCPHRSQQ